MITHQKSPCESTTSKALERTRFFGHQLVGPEDLTADQDYFREKARRHNRMLHGWGVVCGVCVRRGSGDCEIVIEPGYVLGPYGDEIVIDVDHVMDLCKVGLDEECGCCGGAAKDPWCADERKECTAGTKYLAIKYEECLSRPVRRLAGACGGGCDDDCEPSRIREGYTVSLLSELPPGYSTPMQSSPSSVLLPCSGGNPRPCPPCPESPWVILADVTVGPDCTVRGINCFAHRRYAMTWAHYYQVCTPTWGFVGHRAAGDMEFARFMASSGSGNTIADLTVAPDAGQPRALVTIARSNGTTATLPGYFEVQPGETMGALLAREGDRAFFDPVTGEDFTLSDLAGAVAVDRTQPVDSTAAALAVFEGLRVDLPVLRTGREAMAEEVDAGGIKRLNADHGGALGEAGRLLATDLRGVGPGSFVGKKIAKMTIRDVAELDAEAFVKKATRGSPKKNLNTNKKRAKEAWERAHKVLEATKRI